MEATLFSKYRCPKCEERTLVVKDDPQKLTCTGCGDIWEAREVRKFNVETHDRCELCEEREAEIEFAMMVPIGPFDAAQRPVGYRMVRGWICLQCYTDEENDGDIAFRLQLKLELRAKELKRLAEKRKGHESK